MKQEVQSARCKVQGKFESICDFELTFHFALSTLHLNHTPLVYLLFVCSGLSGLIYQVVWVRVFGNVFGNTVYSASLVVAVFMLGSVRIRLCRRTSPQQ